MVAADFVENDEGVHFMNPALPEYTLCGDAFDAPDSEPDWEHGPFRPTKSKIVTCEQCTLIIRKARKVRVSRTHG